MEKNHPSIINAWCSYDIANSAYNLVITATIFPIYYQEITSKIWNNGIIEFLGFTIKNTVIYNYIIAIAYAFIIVISPLLSGIADSNGLKKIFMKFFTILGSVSCIMLFGFKGENVAYGLFWAGLAVVGYAGSLVFYNSFLPIISTPNNHDRVSARGFAYGYAGSVILLIILLLFISYSQWFGIKEPTLAIRISFLVVGIWWILIAQIAFFYLKEESSIQLINFNVITKGYKELKKVINDICHNTSIIIFLFSFFLFSAGVQTLLLVATLFGSAVMHIEGKYLILLIIVIQIVAIIGSIFFGWVSTKNGNKFSIIVMLTIWISVCIGAYFIQTDQHFYILSSIAGFMMGGIQSQARSTYAKFIPQQTTDTASYFSFYDITEKFSIVTGMFIFGYIEQLSGNMRYSALSFGAFFVFALLLISFIKLPHNNIKK